MMWLTNLSIRAKAFATPVFLLLCLALLGAEAYTTLGGNADGLTRLAQSDLAKKKLADDITASITSSQLKLFRYVSWLSNGISGEALKVLEKEIVADASSASAGLQELKSRRDLSAQDQTAIASLEKNWEKYRTVAVSTLEMGAIQPGMAVMMFGEADDLSKTISAELKSITDSATKRTEQVT